MQVSTRHSLSTRLNDFSETVDFQAGLTYISNTIESTERSSSSLDYIFPLSITSKFMKQEKYLLLQMQVTNCSHLSIQILSWEFKNCVLEEDPNETTILRTGQVQHLSFVLSEVSTPAKVSIKYSSSLRMHDRKMHIDPVIDKKMKCQVFNTDYFFLEEESAIYQINEPVVMGEETGILVSLMNGINAKIRVEKSEGWQLISPSLQIFTEKCLLKLVPCKAGNLVIPEIIVWVDKKAIKVEGPKKVFVSPLSKNKKS